MNKKFNGVKKSFGVGVLMFAFAMLTSFLLTFTNSNMVKADENLGSAAVYFIKGAEEDFDGTIVYDEMDYYASNVKEAIQSRDGKGRAYLILPDGFDTAKTIYQYVITKTDQYTFGDEYDSNDHESWNYISSSGFVTLEGFSQGEGNYYVHVRYKLLGSDEIYRATSTNIVVDNTSPGLDASWDPTVPTDSSVTISPIVTGIYGYDSTDIDISSLEFISYKKGTYADYEQYVGASEVENDLTPKPLETTSQFLFYTTSNGTYTICISDRAGNISIKHVEINNIYKNLKLNYVGTLSQEINSVSPIEFGVTGDELGDLSRINWYLTTDGNEQLITNGVDKYTHNTENRVAKYSIRVQIEGSLIGAAAVEFEVTPKKLYASDIAWDAVVISKVYDGTDAVEQSILNFAVKAEVLGDLDQVTLTIVKTYYESIHVSDEIKVFADFTISGDDSSQFDFSSLENEDTHTILIVSNGVIKIRTIKVTLTASDRNYDGTRLVAITDSSMDNVVENDKSKLSLKIYSSNQLDNEGYGLLDTADAGNDKVVSSHVVLHSTSEALYADYELDVQELKINVLKIAVVITLADMTVSYGETIVYKVASTDYSSLLVEEGKMVGTEKLDTIGYDFSQVVINDGNSLPVNVDVYDISLSGQTETTNYTYSYVGGKLTINPINLSVILKDEITGKKYNGVDEYTSLQNPDLYDFETLVLGDVPTKVIYSSSVVEIKNVGTYSILVSAVEFADPIIANNYTIISEARNYVIERKRVELNVVVEDKIYDGTPNIKVVSCTFSNLVDGETLDTSCPASSFKTNDANVAYDASGSVTTKEVNYDLIVSSTEDGLLGNYEWVGIDGAIVNSESENYKVPVTATINPRPLNLNNYFFITKSYDGTAFVAGGSYIMSIDLGDSRIEEMRLTWSDNETGYATVNKSEGYQIVVTLADPKLNDYLTYKASNYTISVATTLGEITPVKVNVDFIKDNGEILTIVYDAQIHLFNEYSYYTYEYENEGVALNGNENIYVSSVTYEAYRDESLSDRVIDNKIIDINMNAAKDVLPYYIKIISVNLTGLEPTNNYEFVFENVGQIIISKQPLQVTFKGEQRDYLGVTVENEFDKNDFKIVGLLGAVEHDLSANIESVEYTFYTDSQCLPEHEIDLPLNAGTYYVVGTLLTPVASFDLSNYDVTFFKTGTLIINKVSLNIHYVSGAETVYYTGQDTKLTSTDFVYEGLVGDDLNKIADITISYNIDGKSSILADLINVKRPDGYDETTGSSSNVLGYEIMVTKAESAFISNYNVTYNVEVVGSNTFTVNPLELSLYIEAINRDYDTTSNVSFVEHSATTPRYTGTIGEESFTINYINGKAVDGSGNEMKDVGTYTVEYTLEVIANDPTKASNYHWQKPANPTVVISPKELLVEKFVTNYVCDSDETKKCKVYDGTSNIPSDFEMTATEESGVFPGETAVITYNLNSSKFVQVADKTLDAIDAGEAIMLINAISVSGNDNYIIVPGQESWEYDAIILKKILDVDLFNVNDKRIVRDYTGDVKFETLVVLVTVESGLQERASVLDIVNVNATAVFNSPNVISANELIITITGLTGDHAANYGISSDTTSRYHEVDGYEVKILPLPITDADIKVENIEKVYDAKTLVPTGFVAYAENESWPNTKLDLNGYTPSYESANASENAKIIISNIGCENTNYVVQITDNTVERTGKITKRFIPLSSLVITPMSKTYDGSAVLNLTGITVPTSYIQVNSQGVADVVTIIAPSFGTFVELSGENYIDSPSVGENKLLRLNDIELDATSDVNYLLVNDESVADISYIYTGGEIIALDVYIDFINGTSVYNGSKVDLTLISHYSITVLDGYTLPAEISSLTTLTPSITLNGSAVTDVIDVGVYTVTPPSTGINVANEENYNFIVKEGTYEITKRKASISLKEGLSSTYTGDPVDLTDISNWNIEARNDAENSGFVNSISSVIADAGVGVIIKDAGSYYISAGTINGINPNNYNIVRGNAVLYVINPKLMNVNVTITSREYDGTVVINESLINVTLNADDYVKEETLTFSVTAGEISAPDASATAYKVSGYTITLLDGTNGGLAANYVIGTYGDEEVIITPRTILVENLFLSDYQKLYKTYDGTKDFINTIEILVKEGVDGGLVIKNGNVEYDVVVIGYDTTTIAYNSEFVGAGNFVKVEGLTVDDSNYKFAETSTTFTDSDGSLILKRMLIPQNFTVSPNTKVYDGLVDETDNVTVTAVGLVDGDVALIGVEIESAILDSRMVGTRILTVKNISIYDIDGTNPRIYNYDLDESASKSEFSYTITAKPVSADDIEAYYDGSLISHTNPLRMPYIPGNNLYDDIDLVTLSFKDGVIEHIDDLYTIVVTSIEFLNEDGTPAYDVNDKETTYYKLKINFNVTVNDNYEYDDSITYIVINNAGIIDPMGVVIKAKEFTKIYGETEDSHEYKDPTKYTWVYYDGGEELGSADYTYLTNAISFNATRTITMDTQQVSSEAYPITISWDTTKTDNYNIIVEGVTLRILPRELKIKAEDSSIMYYSSEAVSLSYIFLDGTSPVIWDEATALPSSTGVQDTLSNVLSAVDESNNPLVAPYAYGEYRIVKNAQADASNPNYTITVTEGVFNVTDDKESIISDINVSGWSNTSVTVTFTATDVIPELTGTPSGVDATNVYYCDSTETNCYVVTNANTHFTFSVTENGDYIIKVADIAGNIKKESVSVYTVLTIAPDFEIISDYQTGHYINEDLDITIDAVATTSYQFNDEYFSYICVSVDGGECTEVGEKIYGVNETKIYTATFEYTFSSNVSGEHTISFTLTDAAGNTREKSLTVKTIYVTTSTSLSVNEEIMNVDFSFNEFDKVTAMVNTYDLHYFFSRQYASSKPNETAFNAHGVDFVTGVDGTAKLSSPAGLNGSYRLNIQMKIVVSEGVYDYLVYQSGTETIRRLSSQPVSLNLSNVVESNEGGMIASYLSTDGSSVIVSNQRDAVATLSARESKFDFVIKYDSNGNEEYRVKLVVDGEYTIVEVVEDSDKVYLLMTGNVTSVNGMQFSKENKAIVLVIDESGVIDSYSYENGENSQISAMAIDAGQVALIGNVGENALVVFTDFASTWEKVIENTKYEDVALRNGMLVVVGSTNETQFIIDNRVYNGGVVSHGLSDGIMVSFDVTGSVKYVKRLSSTANDNINLVEIDDSKVVITGTTAGDNLYYSRFASIPTNANGSNDAFIISYDLVGHLDEFSTLDGDGNEIFNSLSLSRNMIITSVKTTSNLITPLVRSGSPIILNGSGENGFVITYSEALTIEDVAAGSSVYAIQLASLNRNTSQLMILSNTENSYVLQTQRFIVTNDIQVTRNQSTVSVSADGINVKEIRVMKDGEFLQVHNNQFEVLENGSYDITVIDEYDMVATKTLVVDSFVVGEATTRKMTSSMNKIDYAIVAIGLFMIASSIVVRRKKEA